jgi:predicted dinucleotide-binding enzyme
MNVSTCASRSAGFPDVFHEPAGSPNRRALVIAGDDPAAKDVVREMIDTFGFDPVDAGPLKEGGGSSANAEARETQPAPERQRQGP